MQKFKRKLKFAGFSIIEIIIVIAVFALIASSIVIFSLDSLRISSANENRIVALNLIQNQVSAILQNKNDLWATILDNTEDGIKHIEVSGNNLVIADGEATTSGINTSFTIFNVMRDINGEIVEADGIYDINTRRIDLTASWQDALGNDYSLAESFYVSNWNTPTWTQTTEAEFSEGVVNDTIITATGGGAVELDLESVIRGDWCIPEITRTSFNLTGLALATSIWALPNEAYLGTSYGWDGPSFNHIHINSGNPPTINEVGVYDTEAKTNDIWSDLNYAYLATNEDAKEVIIINTDMPPYNEVGYFDAPTAIDSRGVFVKDNIGYLLQGDKLLTFDLTQKTGSRPLIGQVTLDKNGNDIYVRGNYAYIAVQGGSVEMQIVNVTDPANMAVTGNANVNSQSGTAVYVSEDGSRAYIGTSLALFQREFFIVDTSQKTGTRPIIDSFDTGITSVTGISIIQNRAIIVGWLGTEYQVLNIANEADIQYCGGLNWNWGINDIATVIDEDQNAWAYILTNDISGELHVILGGEETGGGGGNGQGDEYLPSGEFTSSVFDSGSTSTRYYAVEWNEQIFENTDLMLQVRSGPSSDLSSRPWVGPDGTSATFFTEATGEYLPALLQNNRYFQYKVYFTSDRVNTPVFEQIQVNYQ